MAHPEMLRRQAGTDAWWREALQRLSRPPQSVSDWMLRAALLSALYASFGALGLQLAQPPGYATAIWPPSGISLALLLLWGRGLWVAVWFGSFLVNGWVGWSHGAGVGASSLGIAALIASGSALQAVVGATLIRRYVGYPTALDQGASIWRFMLLAGPLACLIAASIGPLTLYASGRLPASDLIYNSFTWWVGDVMGVFLVAPMLVVWAAERRAPWRSRLSTVTGSVAVSLIVGALIVQQTNLVESRRIQNDFEQRAEAVDRRLADTVDAMMRAVKSLVALYGASDEVRYEEFGHFAGEQVLTVPGVVSVLWVQRIDPAELAAYERSAREAGEPDYQVFGYRPDGQRAPLAVQPGRALFAVRYVAPESSRLLLGGLDIGSEPTRREVLERATQQGRAVVSRRIRLMQDGSAGVMIAAPLIPRRGGPVEGYVVVAVHLQMLMADALQGLPLDGIAVNLVDLDAAPAAQLLFGSDPEALAAMPLRWQGNLQNQDDFHWALRIGAEAGYLYSQRSLQAWLTQVGVLLFSAMLGSFLLVLTGRAARVEQLVGERTDELRHKNLALSREIQQRRRGEQALRDSEARFRSIFESSGTGIVFGDGDGRLLQSNAAFAALMGGPVSELEVPDFPALTHPDDRVTEAAFMREIGLGQRDSYRIEKRCRAAIGERWVASTVSVIRDQGGHPQYFVAVVADIDQRKRAENRLRLHAEVFEHIGEAIVIADAEQRIVSVNRAFSQITGWSEGEAIGRSADLLLADAQAGEQARIWQQAQQHGVWRGEVWGARKDGGPFPAWMTHSVVRDSRGNVTYHVVVFSDVTERKAAEERIRYLAQIDALTGLPNRLLLGERLNGVLRAAAASRRPFAVMFIDIDRFKNINDSLGHSTGDALLHEMAKRLSAVLRSGDTVARHGGDEFVVLMPDVEDSAQVAQAARRMLKATSQPMTVDQHVLGTTSSIGIAMYPDDGSDAESLMKNADTAMYVAKNSGRNNFQFFTPDMNARVREFLSIENDLRHALQHGEFRLYYQPQVDTVEGRVIGMEALLRWQHPQRGLLLAGQFIRVAEESGLIDEIGDWVLNEACRQNRGWQDAGLKAVPVSVNLSAFQLHRRDPVENVRRALAVSGLAPAWLELEVTESMLMQDVERVIETLYGIERLGVQIALDDFGTGYSSLAYLQRFPLGKLKVDQTFVRDISLDQNDAAICKAIIALARTLGLKVVAEGVENEAQLLFLREHYCDAIQGSLASWALPPEQMAEFLVKHA
jgi:diguanylate cyclase (GGDEF)-like protein/PAS domain S-box-containing protein